MPKRIKMTRQRPWRADNSDAVIVARPSKWGNPYRWHEIPNYIPPTPDGDEGHTISDAERRRLSVSDFRHDLRDPGIEGYPSIDEIRSELAGRDLACWCPLDQPCHADVLLDLANTDDRPGEVR